MRARTAAPPASDLVLRGLARRRVDVAGVLFETALLVMLLLSLAVLVTLLAEVARGATDVFAERGAGFLEAPLSSLPERAGVWQGLVGSALLMLFVVAIAFPLGIGAAVYLEEYAPDNRMTRFVDVNVRNLAGVPSVVYGLLGLAVFVEAFGGVTGGRSVAAGGLTLAVLVLPLVVITSAEALRAVPRSIREAAYGVGATRWEVVRHHVVPAAAPGILTGTILSLSRALGETAPLILVGAVTGFLAVGDDGFVGLLRERFTALPMIVFGWARQPSEDFRALTAAAIAVLLVVIMLANATAILLRNRYERKW